MASIMRKQQKSEKNKSANSMFDQNNYEKKSRTGANVDEFDDDEESVDFDNDEESDDFEDDSDSDDDFDSDDFDDNDDEDDDRESDASEDEEPLLISSLLSTPVVPVGEYDAVIVNLAIEQRDGKYGIFHFLDVYLEIVTKKATFKVKDRMTGNLNEGTKLSKLMLALIGRVPKADYNLRKILGKEVGVRITHRKDEKGRLWPEVEYLE